MWAKAIASQLAAQLKSSKGSWIITRDSSKGSQATGLRRFPFTELPVNWGPTQMGYKAKLQRIVGCGAQHRKHQACRWQGTNILTHTKTWYGLSWQGSWPLDRDQQSYSIWHTDDVSTGWALGELWQIALIAHTFVFADVQRLLIIWNSFALLNHMSMLQVSQIEQTNSRCSV